ncbi:MAG: GTPase Era [Oscillospiraceae bacterium]|jgi:GTP-binding protein Era|nr:GTPase Era [Oscillospiraceae bacterium]
MAEITRTLVAAIVGRPNVGKSTLVNAVAGEKIAIVSPKPQTTRHRIRAVANRGETQFVFVDTPGFHRPRTRLGEYMVKTVRDSFHGVDAVVLVVDGAREDDELLTLLRNANTPAVIAINKIDALDSKAELLPIIARYSQFHHIVPISAKLGEGVEELLSVLSQFAQDGGALFPQDMTSDQDDRTVVGELVREKLLMCLDKEIPHGIAVDVTKFSERDSASGDPIIDVDVTIYCERESHKRIIIGKRGEMLRRVGSLSRRDIERFMGTRVFLQTWVKVREGWRDRAGALREFGYGDR